MAFPQRAAQPTGKPEAPMGGANGEPQPGPSIHHAHKTIHRHLAQAHALVGKNPALAKQHINAAGMAATAMHNAACPECNDDEGGADAGQGQPPGPGTMDGAGGAYGGQ